MTYITDMCGDLQPDLKSHHLQGTGHIVVAPLQAVQFVLKCVQCIHLQHIQKRFASECELWNSMVIWSEHADELCVCVCMHIIYFCVCISVTLKQRRKTLC